MVFFQVEASQLWLVVMGTLNDRSPDTRSPHKKVVSGTLEQQQLMVIGAVAPKASQLGTQRQAKHTAERSHVVSVGVCGSLCFKPLGWFSLLFSPAALLSPELPSSTKQ